MEWTTTTTILEGLRDFQNEAVWQRFVERFRQPIVAFGSRVGLSRAEAEDVAQDTLVAFADAYRAGKYDRERGRLSRWLFGIAYRQILRGRRRESRREVQVADEDGTSFWAALPDEQAATVLWDREWEGAVWQVCLQRVRGEVRPDTFRAFELTVLEGRGADEAASLAGVPVKTVYNAKHRILKRLRALRAEIETVD